MIRVEGPIAFLSDIHWGKSKDSELKLKLLDSFLSWAETELTELGIKNIMFLGDWYDNRNMIHVKTGHHYSYRRLKKLAEKFRVFMIPGNHDYHLKSHDSQEKINSIEIFNELKNVTVFLAPEELELDGGRRALIVPWNMLPETPPAQKYDYLFGHFEWQGAKTYGKIIEDGVSPAKLTDFASDIFTGHIHIRDVYNYKAGTLYSTGCPLELDWGDVGNVKGIYLLDPMMKEIDFLENTFSPKHVEFIYSRLEKGKNHDFSAAKGNFVKLTVDKEHTPKKLLELVTLINAAQPLRSVFTDYVVETQGIDELIRQVSGTELDLAQKNVVRLPPRDQVLVYIDTHSAEYASQGIDVNKLKAMSLEFFDKIADYGIGDDDE